jgi:hypothetical protein
MVIHELVNGGYHISPETRIVCVRCTCEQRPLAARGIDSALVPSQEPLLTDPPKPQAKRKADKPSQPERQAAASDKPYTYNGLAIPYDVARKREARPGKADLYRHELSDGQVVYHLVQARGVIWSRDVSNDERDMGRQLAGAWAKQQGISYTLYESAKGSWVTPSTQAQAQAAPKAAPKAEPKAAPKAAATETRDNRGVRAGTAEQQRIDRDFVVLHQATRSTLRRTAIHSWNLERNDGYNMSRADLVDYIMAEKWGDKYRGGAEPEYALGIPRLSLDGAQRQRQLDGMTKSQLQVIADSEGIEYTDKLTPDELRKVIMIVINESQDSDDDDDNAYVVL